MSSTTVINTPESEFEHAKELVRGALPAKQQEGVRIFENLAAQGNSEACYMLGCLAERFSWCYTAPDQGQKDIDLETYWFTKAFELFKKEAENGNLKSQTHLAEMYACGCGTKKDSDKAAYWQKIVFAEYLRRAEAGDAEKQLAVAEMYKKGCITEQDFEKAAFWYEKVSEHADAETLSDIASEYLNGYMGTSEKNIPRVEALLRRCADTADAQLLHEIGMNFIHSAIYRSVGFTLLQKSADMGCQESKVSLARMYLMQHETSPEISKMRETLEEALSSGTISQYHVNVELKSLGRYYHDKAEYYLDIAQYGYNCDAALRIALRLLSWEPYNPAEEVFSILKEIASLSNINRSLAEFILGCCYKNRSVFQLTPPPVFPGSICNLIILAC